jgi:hypothetical protein
MRRVLFALVLLAAQPAFAIPITLFVDTPTFVERSEDIVVAKCLRPDVGDGNYIDGLRPAEVEVVMVLKGNKALGKLRIATIYEMKAGEMYLLANSGGRAYDTNFLAIAQRSVVKLPEKFKLGDLKGKKVVEQVDFAFNAAGLKDSDRVSPPNAKPEVKFTLPADAGFPAPKKLVLVKAGVPGPGQAKHEAILEITTFGKTATLPDAGPFDLWWIPQHGGMATKIMAGESFKVGLREIALLEIVGGVRVRGDNRARPQVIALTEPNAPGPDDVGYAPLATCKEFKSEMILPAGFYALWFRGGNSARAEKLESRLKVLSGKIVDVD